MPGLGTKPVRQCWYFLISCPVHELLPSVAEQLWLENGFCKIQPYDYSSDAAYYINLELSGDRPSGWHGHSIFHPTGISRRQVTVWDTCEGLYRPTTARVGGSQVPGLRFLAFVVAGTFSSAMGILRARCSVKTHSVLPTIA
jgi:hypothetical protein